MNQIKFFGNICKHTNTNNISTDLSNHSINQVLDILNDKYNVDQSLLDSNNLLIAVNNVEISVLNNHDTVIKNGDVISIISISHGG
jgi:molybdopterin converting factor small subunit|tara:strand:- start:275 stop:532 length:258 start_codon:yes stop_codon:yes gene_type:complete